MSKSLQLYLDYNQYKIENHSYIFYHVMSDTVRILYKEHHTWLYGWLRQRLKQDCLAADLVQDTFVKLLQHHERYAHYDHPRALLTTIAKNLANQNWRRKKVEQAYLDSLLVLDERYYPSPEQQLLAIEALTELSHVLSHLQARERQVFMLWQIDNLSYAAIAEQLNVAVITIKRDVKKIMLCCLYIFDLDD